MTLTERQRTNLSDLADDVRTHFDSIAQDVPTDSFVVGGAVRDALLGLDPNDFDFVVVGETAESMQEKGFEPIEASSFPVFHDSEHEEWALAREEQSTGDGYTGFEVFTDDVTLRSDLKRRDLTMNAMALNPRAGPVDATVGSEKVMVTDVFGGDDFTVFDPHGGFDDLQNGVLRHVSDAFAEDPLRIMRCARYAARFPEFEVDEDTMSLMRQLAPKLNRMSRDRVGDEVVKTMEQAEHPSRFWEVLRDCGALAVLFPELDRANIVPAGAERFHAEGDTFTHSMMVLDRMHELCEERGIEGTDRVRRLLMAVVHDIGKVVSADEQGGLHSDDPPMRFGGHDQMGADAVPRVAGRLGLSSELEACMRDACALHMDVHDVPQMGANELLSFFEDQFPQGMRIDPDSTVLPRVDGDPVSHFGATAWEMVDLAHADHEGRLQESLWKEFEDEPNIGIESSVYDTIEEITGDDIEEYRESADEIRTERPVFDREPFERRVRAVLDVVQNVDGHDALETGLCDDHSGFEIDWTDGTFEADGQPVPAVMNECPGCRTPDEWVGDRLDQMKRERLSEAIGE